MATSNEWILKLVLDATNVSRGAEVTSRSLEKLEDIAKKSGQTLEGLVDATLRSSQAQISQGQATAAQIEYFYLIQKHLDDIIPLLNKLSSVEGPEAVTTAIRELGKEFDILKEKTQNALSLPLSHSVGGISLTKTLNDLLYRASEFRHEGTALGETIKGVFESPIASADKIINLVRALDTNLIKTSVTAKEARGYINGIVKELKDMPETKETTQALMYFDLLLKSIRGQQDLSKKDWAEIRGEIDQAVASTLNLPGHYLEWTREIINARSVIGLTNEELEKALRLDKERVDVISQLIAGEEKQLSKVADINKLRAQLNEIAQPGPQQGIWPTAGKEVPAGQVVGGIRDLSAIIDNYNLLKQIFSEQSGTVTQLQEKQQSLNYVMQKLIDLQERGVPVSEDFERRVRDLGLQFGFVVEKGNELNSFIGALRERSEKTGASMNSLSADINTARKASEVISSRFKNFDQLMDIAIGKIIRYRAAFFLMSKSIESMKNSIEIFKNVQNELAQIEKVTVPVVGLLKTLKEAAFDFAITFGQSVTDVLSIMKIWAQQGKSLNDILALTRITLIAVNAANLTTEQAVEGLTAITNAYKYENYELINVLDKLTAVQASYAVTTQDLIDAIRLIASAASNVGISLEELTGLVTAVATVTRKSGKAVAQSLKTIFARFERETTVTQLAALGVQVQETTGEVKPLAEVLLKVNEAWGQMAEAERFAVAQSVAGVHRYADFLVLMDNFEESLAATKTATEASGNALRNNVIQMKTLSSQIKVVQASFAKLGENIMSSGLGFLIKGVLELGRVFADVFSNKIMSFAISALAGLIGVMVIGTGTVIALKLAFRGLTSRVLELSGAHILARETETEKTIEQREATAAASIHSATLKELTDVYRALGNEEARYVVLAGKEIEIHRATAAAAAGSTAAKVSIFTSFTRSIKGVIATLFSLNFWTKAVNLSLSVLMSLLRSLGFWIGAASLLLTFFASKLFKARVENIKFGESIISSVKAQREGIEVQGEINDKIKEHLDTLEKVSSAYKDTEKGSVEYYQRLLQLSRITDKLVVLDGKFNRVKNQSLDIIDDSTRAYEMYNNILKETELRRERLRKEEKKAMKDALEMIGVINNLINVLYEMESVNKIKIGGEIFDFGSAEDQRNLEQKLSIGIGDVVKNWVKKAATQGIFDARILFRVDMDEEETTKVIRDKLLKALKDQKPAIRESWEVLHKELTKLGPLAENLFGSKEDIEKVLATDNAKDFADAWYDMTEAQIKSRDTIPEMIEYMQEMGNAFTSSRKALEDLQRQLRQIIKDIVNFKLEAKALEQTGYAWEQLKKQFESSILPIRKAEAEVKALNEIFHTQEQELWNVQNVLESVGLSYNVAEEEASAAQKHMEELTKVMIELKRINIDPDTFLAFSDVQEIGKVLDLKKAISFTKEELEELKEATSEFDERGVLDSVDAATRRQLDILRAGSQDFSLEDILEMTGEIERGAAGQEEKEKRIKAVRATNALLMESIRAAARETLALDRLKIRALAEHVKLAGHYKQIIERERSITDEIYNARYNLLGILRETEEEQFRMQRKRIAALSDEIEMRAQEEYFRVMGKKYNKQEVNSNQELSALYSDILMKIKQQIRDEQTLLYLQQDIKEATERTRKEIDHITFSSKLMADNEKSYKEVLEKVLDIKSQLLDVSQEEIDLIKNQGRVSELDDEIERRQELIRLTEQQIGGGYVMLNGVVMKLVQSNDLWLGTWWDTLEAANVSISAIEKWDEELQQLTDEQKKAYAEQPILKVLIALAKINKELEVRNAIIDRGVSIANSYNNALYDQAGVRESFKSFRFAKQEFDILKERIRIEKEAYAARKQQFPLLDDAIREARDILGTINAEELRKSLDISIEDAEELARNVTNLDNLTRELAEKFANVTLTKTLDQIEEFNSKLRVQLELQNSILDVQGELTQAAIAYNYSNEKQQKQSLFLQLQQGIISKRNSEYRLKQAAQLKKEELEAITDKSDGQKDELRRVEEILKFRREDFETSKKNNEELYAIGNEIVKSFVESHQVFRLMMRDIEHFNELVTGIASGIADAFLSGTDFVVDRFAEIRSLQNDQVNLLNQIDEKQANLDPMADDYAKSLEDIKNLNDELNDVNEKLENARNIFRGILDYILQSVANIGNIVIEAQGNLLKKNIEEIFSQKFGDAQKKRIEAMNAGIAVAFAAGSRLVFQAIATGALFHAQEIIEAINLSTGAMGPEDRLASAMMLAQASFDAAMERLPEDIRVAVDKAMVDAGKDIMSPTQQALYLIGQQLAAMLGVSLGASVGGNRGNALMGSQIGALLGLVNPALGILGSALGGLVGGFFGKDDESIEVTDRNTSALDRNTVSIQANTQELSDLRNQVINAPSRFVLPPTSAYGGGVIGTNFATSGDTVPSYSAGSTNIQIVVNGEATDRTLNRIKNAVIEAHQEGARRFGKRVYG